MKFSIKLFYTIGLFLFFFALAPVASAGTSVNELSAGCKSCVQGYDCSRINKTCNATCKANLYTEENDLKSCTAGCIRKLETCLLDANKSCKFYCADN